MARPSRRAARLLGAGAAAACFTASAAVVWHASYSAFSATTANPSSNWATGSVALADDDANTAMFSASNLKPGSTGSRCIAVTSTGSLPSAVKLYGTGSATTNALSSWINLTITQGTGGSFGSCTGFTPQASGASVFTGSLASFASTATGYSTGLGNWTPTGSGSDTRVFQVSYTLDPTAPNSTQGGTASVGFTWEAQNT